MKTRIASPTGAILYDSDRVEAIDDAFFTKRFWEERSRLEGSQSSRRGAALFVNYDGARWVLRHYHRGGRMASLSRDSYLWLGETAVRSFAEWELLQQVVGWSLPAPRPVAARYQRRGLMYKADILIERIPGARSLTELLSTDALPPDGMRNVGAVVRQFHERGVDHADLNADNILFDRESRVYLIDFDRGRIRTPAVSWQQGNLSRLHRSLERRRERIESLEFSESHWQELLAGYGLP